VVRRRSPVAPPVDVSDFVDHIDSIVNLIGVDHVGISSYPPGRWALR
jgi:membrane dipeptidase